MQYKNSRFSLLLTMLLLFLATGFAIRLMLLLTSLPVVDISLFQLIKIFGVGLFYDTIAASYYFIPLVIYFIMMPSKLFNTTIHRYFLYALLFTTSYMMLFNGVSEWFFWEEFGKRFNFIAVDYLVYTHEVIHNILESYPIPLILSTIAVINAVLFFFLFHRSNIIASVNIQQSHWRKRVKTGSVFLMIPLLAFMLLHKQSFADISSNSYNNELAKNGLYSLFSAFRHNTLEYTEFYKTDTIQNVMSNLERFEHFNDTHLKQIQSDGNEEHYNIMLIMVESLSAKYMGIYGNTEGLTPNLDRLAQESVFFDNLYATGTRTVRGMEAVTLSIPPTPGRSIVKRPDNHNMFSSGFVFRDKGYDTNFIYAGHGYFDNMNDFFSHNGFNVIDRTDFTQSEIHFANVWGVCDEDLFDKALQTSEKSYRNNKPFFNFIMTTSNHRPYTYPDGAIDIPSHTGRSGGVKYTDYAIKKFLQKARTKAWFNNTLFVIVADHNGGSAGKTSLPIWRYKIPLIIYAPDLIVPQTVHKLASQIDVMPTVMALLHFKYESMFYGNNILSENFQERAFIGNYQQLGYVKENRLSILLPNKQTRTYRIENQTLQSADYRLIAPNADDILHAVTYYQSADYFYKNHRRRRPAM